MSSTPQPFRRTASSTRHAGPTPERAAPRRHLDGGRAAWTPAPRPSAPTPTPFPASPLAVSQADGEA